jgi:ribonuclease D
MPGTAAANPPIVADTERVAELAAAIARAGSFAFDLEFVSEDRYVPELALVQVAWGDPDAPEVAAVDPLAVDPAPLFALVADPDVEVIAHAARQDLGLLATVYRIAAAGLVDTQIASSFVGLPDQVGYARMVQELTGQAIDKVHQHTDWKRRPLSEAQVAYALDDVRYLQRIWRELSARLAARGRLGWAVEESARLAAGAAVRRPPEEAYRSLGGWGALKGPGRALLRELAAWREREALASNTPPSWIAPDSALVDIARRAPGIASQLGRVRGLPGATVRRHGEAILAALARGAASEEPIDAPPSLGVRQQAQTALVLAIVQAKCASAELPVRLVGGRAECEALVVWFARQEGGAGDGGDVALLEGWRAELCGNDAIAWLRGEVALVADPASPGGLRLTRI